MRKGLRIFKKKITRESNKSRTRGQGVVGQKIRRLEALSLRYNRACRIRRGLVLSPSSIYLFYFSIASISLSLRVSRSPCSPSPARRNTRREEKRRDAVGHSYARPVVTRLCVRVCALCVACSTNNAHAHARTRIHASARALARGRARRAAAGS